MVSGALLAGCAQLGYYTHLARGQMELLSRREPIADIVADTTRDSELRRRLALVLEARRFAVERLALPDNASYTLYADLGRPYVLWNVFATPEFSLEPVQACFPISGCVAYRGHYQQARAEAQIAKLRAQGYDVDIGGVPAYSTLGWFDDPVLNTMMQWDDAALIGTVFHELAHQVLYVKDDTAFNESFARFVEQEGLRQFFSTGALKATDTASADERERAFTRLVLASRETLSALYVQPLSAPAMRERKAAVFAQLKADYARMREEQWGGYSGYDAWFARELNNASLLPFGLYDEWVPAFENLFEEQSRDWIEFYAACRALGKRPSAERREHMQELISRAS